LLAVKWHTVKLCIYRKVVNWTIADAEKARQPFEESANVSLMLRAII
jgi:hypothetical protein